VCPPAAGAVPAGAQGLTFNRRSTVSLAGGWGELRLGRDYVPQFWSLTVFDPFNTLGAGGNLMMSSIVTGVTAARASNSIGYLLPSNLGGVYGQAMYYLGENVSGTATSNDGDGYGVRLGYARGPLNVAFASGRTKYAAGNVRQSNLGAEWNFGVARAQAQLSRDSNGALDAKGALLGVLVPIGVGELRAAYSRYSTDASGEPTSKKLALGYVHHLSKRTALYATWARVKNSGGAAVALNGSATAANASSSGYDLGIRHSF
jgi:predicted porin